MVRAALSPRGGGVKGVSLWSCIHSVLLFVLFCLTIIGQKVCQETHRPSPPPRVSCNNSLPDTPMTTAADLASVMLVCCMLCAKTPQLLCHHAVSNAAHKCCVMLCQTLCPTHGGVWQDPAATPLTRGPTQPACSPSFAILGDDSGC